MKRQKLILTVILTALIASSCAAEAGNDTVGDTPPAEVTSTETSAETLSESETAEASETTEAAETSPTAGTTEADVENVTGDTETSVTEKLSELSVAEVGIVGHIDEFDDVVPCKFTLGGEVELDPAILETAVNAYKQTDYYKDALEYMREKFTYDDGGNIVYSESGEPVDPDKTDFVLHNILRYHKELLIETAEHEIDFAPVPEWSYKIGDGYLTVLKTALANSLFIWSGSGTSYIPVYINGDGEAFVLDEACAQDYNSNGCFTLEYEDGSIHAVMDFGHNSIQFATVYSFEGGTPKLEISGVETTIYVENPIITANGIENDIPVLFRRNHVYMTEMFFWNSATSEYCMVDSADPDEELARAICSDETVLAEIPDAWELYQKYGMNIYGGRYITFHGRFNGGCTFSLDPQTGGLARTEGKAVTRFSNTDNLPEGIKSYNIDLT